MVAGLRDAVPRLERFVDLDRLRMPELFQDRTPILPLRASNPAARPGNANAVRKSATPRSDGPAGAVPAFELRQAGDHLPQKPDVILRAVRELGGFVVRPFRGRRRSRGDLSDRTEPSDRGARLLQLRLDLLPFVVPRPGQIP